jgi:membrane-anchored protein YejM (alkaline phosphatase superfamily)
VFGSRTGGGMMYIATGGIATVAAIASLLLLLCELYKLYKLHLANVMVLTSVMFLSAC